MLDNFIKTATEWGTRLLDVHFWWQLLCILVAISIALFINRRVQILLQTKNRQHIGFRHVAVRTVQRLLWPLTSLLLLLPAKAVFVKHRLPSNLLEIAVPILLALALIRTSVYILRKAFNDSPLVKSSENILVSMIWGGVVLHLVGWLPAALKLLDSLALNLGDMRVSILNVFQFILLISATFAIATWLAGLLNNWLQKSEHISPSMQIAFSKFSRFILLTLAFLIALNAMGINLSSLAIFGGALGVGLGFGLQRIASNFISGFILVMDRSIKPGDIITVGNQFGWVHQLNARYVVVRNREGVDTLIPNENLITREVINWSYSDRNVRISIKLQVSYNDDPAQAMNILMDCAFASPRVLQDPPPVVQLTEFADSGIGLELMVWYSDPENGSGSIRSDIHLAIWKAFKEANITIPYPQRDLHIKSGLLPVSLGQESDNIKNETLPQ
jgi:small-conductance mechanosensitive channel